MTDQNRPDQNRTTNMDTDRQNQPGQGQNPGQRDDDQRGSMGHGGGGAGGTSDTGQGGLNRSGPGGSGGSGNTSWPDQGDSPDRDSSATTNPMNDQDQQRR